MEDLLEKRKKLICELVEDEKYVPMKEKELAIFMQVKPEDRRELKRILEELLEEGKIEQTKRGRYVRAEKKLLRAVGLYQSSENFGFVVPDNKKRRIFLSRGKRKRMPMTVRRSLQNISRVGKRAKVRRARS